MADPKPMRPEDPTSVAGHRLLGRLGEGGQGTVFLGEAPGGARVAVKLLHPHLIGDEDARERFLREVRIATRVARFCTAQVLDAGLAGSRPYIISEYVPGRSLEESVREDGPRTGAALERLGINTATALAGIHAAGVLHRDFKPANILLGPDGPVVIDFGIARALDPGEGGITRQGQIAGTPYYMAPEQLDESAQAGPPSDIFAWAASMVYAANGRPAFNATTLPGIFQKVLVGEPELGTLQGPLRDLVAACLAKDPAQRPTAEQLVRHLSGGAPGAVPQSATLPEAAKTDVPVFQFRDAPPKRRPAWVIPAAVVAGVALLAAVPAVLLLKGGGSGAGTSGPNAGAAPMGVAASVSGGPGAAGPTASVSPGTSASPSMSPSAKPAKSGSHQPHTPGPEVLGNTGFEGGLSPWTTRGGATLVTSGQHGGSQAVRLKAVPGQDAAVEQQIGALQPNTTYLLTGWVRSDGSRTVLGIKSTDSRVGNWKPTSSSSYVFLSMTFTTGPTVPAIATVFCWRNVTGTGFCDDISLHAN